MIGRIYRIIHLESELCYIGSTFNELRHRWQQHQSDYKKWLDGKHALVSIYPHIKNHGKDKFKMILIKEYEVVDRKHLEVYEQLWINNFRKSCVNQYNPFTITYLQRKNYRLINQESIKEKKKEYYDKNKAMLIEKVKLWNQDHSDHRKDF